MTVYGSLALLAVLLLVSCDVMSGGILAEGDYEPGMKLQSSHKTFRFLMQQVPPVVESAVNEVKFESDTTPSPLTHPPSQTPSPPQTISVVVNATRGVLHTVDEAFVSVAFDMALFATGRLSGFNFTAPRLRTLVAGLSPTVLRVGGSASSYMFFDVSPVQLETAELKPVPVVMTEADVDGLAGLAMGTGSRVLMDLNNQLRLGVQWDPSGAITLMDYVSARGLAGCFDWELGNEPEYDAKPGQAPLTPKQIAADYLMLKRVVDSYPSLKQSRIVGPDDVGFTPGSTGFKILEAVASAAGGFLHAITFHQYYFQGDVATYKDYIDPAHFPALSAAISDAKSAVSQSSHPNLPLWIGETSDAWHSGTKNVSDRFVSGFLWLEKLGLAARSGVELVVRQTMYGGNYGLVGEGLEPNPDYWVSLVHRRLVGKEVLDVGLSFSSGPTDTIRVYAHCAAPTTPHYQPGAVALFAVNVSPHNNETLVFPAWKNLPIDVYLLTPFNNDLLSSVIQLNYVDLKMIDDVTLPKISPVTSPAGKLVVMPALSMGFFVVPGAAFRACKSEGRMSY